MDERLQKWIEANVGWVFSSPRNKTFKRKTREFEIVSIDCESVKIRFVDPKRYVLKPFSLSMFDRALDCLINNKGKPVRLGAKVSPPYDKGTIEAAIWKKSFVREGAPCKASPHICDILVLSGIAEYTTLMNESNKRKVQCIRLANH